MLFDMLVTSKVVRVLLACVFTNVMVIRIQGF